MEVRYVKITSCKDCEYNGYSYATNTKCFINICVNPNTMNMMNVPKQRIDDKYYPITNRLKSNNDDCPIPAWCKLPTRSEVYYGE